MVILTFSGWSRLRNAFLKHTNLIKFKLILKFNISITKNDRDSILLTFSNWIYFNPGEIVSVSLLIDVLPKLLNPLQLQRCNAFLNLIILAIVLAIINPFLTRFLNALENFGLKDLIRINLLSRNT
jgi:hypothetical protein